MPGAGGEREKRERPSHRGGLVVNGDGVSVEGNGKGRQLNGADGCTRRRMQLTSLNCTLKMIKVVKLMLHILHRTKKIKAQKKRVTFELS